MYGRALLSIASRRRRLALQGRDGTSVIAVAGVPHEYKTYYAGDASGVLVKSTNDGIRLLPSGARESVLPTGRADVRRYILYILHRFPILTSGPS
jgi:hypothetical protein